MVRLSTVVAVSLAATLLVTVGGIVVLSALDRGIPSILDSLAVGALGALAALLSRVGEPADPTPVTIHQPAADPVPVVPADGPNP